MAFNTIVDYWQSEVDRIRTSNTGALDVAKADLAKAQEDEAKANASLTDSAKVVTSTRDDVDKQRRALAAIPMPADGDPLLVAMADAIAKWRDAVADNVAKEAASNVARVRRERANDRVTALAAAGDEAEAALKREKEFAAKVAIWK